MTQPPMEFCEIVREDIGPSKRSQLTIYERHSDEVKRYFDDLRVAGLFFSRYRAQSVKLDEHGPL